MSFFLKEMVEGIANGVEDYLIDGLSFKLPPGATYITDRKSVTYYTSGSNEYSTSGTKLIKIVANSDGWMDPSTLRITFDVFNKGPPGALLRPISGGWSFFRRMRILSGGCILEDISDFNRTQELFTTLISKNSKTNVDAEGFGLPAFDYATDETVANFPGIPSGEYQTISFTPLSGILSQPKYLPLRYLNGLTLELEMVSDPTVPFVLNTIAPFTTANTSITWVIQNVQMKCDIVTLDNALDNSYAELLLSGKSLPISYSTYISQYQSILNGTNSFGATVGQQKVRLNVARSLSRLKSVFVSFDKANTVPSAVYKDFNSFYSPMMTTADVPIMGQEGEVEWQMQLGNKLYPETPVRSHSESFYQLRKCLGVQSSALHSFNIDGQSYRRRRFVIAMDTEAVLQASFSGKNTRAGDLLNIKFEHLGTDSTKYAHNMYVILHSDNIMEIRDSGVVVYD